MSNRLWRLGRRTFLQLAAATAAFGPLPARARPAPDATPAIGLAQIFERPASAIVIGRRYLDRYPDDHASLALASELLRASRGEPARAHLDLRARIRRDFERGDSVLLDGWILARSECRACAAVALSAAGGSFR
jgi:hypothetical protein